MSIYSANRSGRISASMIPYNEDYSYNDIGRILYESQVNNMAIFEAMVINDLVEMKGLHEGTLLEAEAKAKEKLSIKGLATTIKNAIIKWYKAIKGAILSLITKLKAMIGDNKAFLKNFDEVFNKKMKAGEKLKFDPSKTVVLYDLSKISIISVQDIEDLAKKNMNSADSLSNEDLTNDFLSEFINNEYKVEGSKDFKEKAIKHCMETYSLEGNNIDVFKEKIAKSSEEIDYLQETEKYIAKIVDKTMKALDNYVKQEEDSAKKIQNINTVFSAYQKAVSNCVGTSIGMVKSNVKTSRSALTSLIRSFTESAMDPILYEAATTVDADEIEYDVEEPVDPEEVADGAEFIDDVTMEE